MDLLRNKNVTDLGEWKHRQGSARDALMEEGKMEVANALELISRQGLTTMIMIAMILMIFVSIVFREELIAVGEEKGDKNRRAAVFYFDKVGFSVISRSKKKTLIGSFWTLTASLVAGGLETFRAQSGGTSLRHHRDDPP